MKTDRETNRSRKGVDDSEQLGKLCCVEAGRRKAKSRPRHGGTASARHPQAVLPRGSVCIARPQQRQHLLPLW